MPQSVLVAEDERNIAESLAFLMEKAGLEVRVAYDGPTTLQMLADGAPDVVLLDLMLPGCDGFEVLKSVRDDPGCRDVRVLILTAKGREIDRRKAMELGVDDFVTKPFSTREVVERVKALLPARGA